MFTVVQQHAGKYDVHIFTDQLHFRAWMLVHKTLGMRPASQAQGCKNLEINHVGEVDLEVSDKRFELDASRYDKPGWLHSGEAQARALRPTNKPTG